MRSKRHAGWLLLSVMLCTWLAGCGNTVHVDLAGRERGEAAAVGERPARGSASGATGAGASQPGGALSANQGAVVQS